MMVNAPKSTDENAVKFEQYKTDEGFFRKYPESAEWMKLLDNNNDETALSDSLGTCQILD